MQSRAISAARHNAQEDCLKAQASELAALAAGKVLPAAAQLLTNLIEGQRRALETTELARRLDAIEDLLKAQANGTTT